MATKTQETLCVVMPAYNEAENIEKTVKDWYPILEGKSKKSRLAIADSGSKDDTHKILLELKKQYPQLEILPKTNQYHGPKVLALYRYAIKNRADWIFQTDSDGQTNPAEFKAFWDLREKHDAILGERTVRGDGASRKRVEDILCKLLRLYFGVKIKDSNAPFRLMKTELVAKYIDKLPEDYNLPNVMFSTYFVYFKENIIFKEITFKPRQAGTNSINLKKIFGIGWDALTDFAKLKKDLKRDEKTTKQ